MTEKSMCQPVQYLVSDRQKDVNIKDQIPEFANFVRLRKVSHIQVSDSSVVGTGIFNGTHTGVNTPERNLTYCYRACNWPIHGLFDAYD